MFDFIARIGRCTRSSFRSFCPSVSTLRTFFAALCVCLLGIFFLLYKGARSISACVPFLSFSVSRHSHCTHSVRITHGLLSSYCHRRRLPTILAPWHYGLFARIENNRVLQCNMEWHRIVAVVMRRCQAQNSRTKTQPDGHGPAVRVCEGARNRRKYLASVRRFGARKRTTNGAHTGYA